MGENVHGLRDGGQEIAVPLRELLGMVEVQRDDGDGLGRAREIDSGSQGPMRADDGVEVGVPDAKPGPREDGDATSVALLRSSSRRGEESVPMVGFAPPPSIVEPVSLDQVVSPYRHQMGGGQAQPVFGGVPP